MAQSEQHIDMVPVDAKDILADRQSGWNSFMKAATWGIGIVVVLLVLLYLLAG
ncbi:aa3-type cytochrome c oxidase subunit IV [Roseomonas sp. BN140053]|uniref:aa3-type cytochrome c oxidase subunit IV n=1 Tax=Roseomonas sp. BN140053 TaxID=3391898 RepID=UPI0039E962F4